MNVSKKALSLLLSITLVASTFTATGAFAATGDSTSASNTSVADTGSTSGSETLETAKTNLTEAIELASSYNKAGNETTYTADSWSAFQSKLTAATEMQENTTATPEAVREAADELNSAREKLVAAAAAKANLAEVIEKAHVIIQNNYTPESLEAFQTALSAATEIYEKNESTDMQADADQLNDAIKGLVLTSTAAGDAQSKINNLNDKTDPATVKNLADQVVNHFSPQDKAKLGSDEISKLEAAVEDVSQKPNVWTPTADSNITGNAKMTTAPTVSGLLLASGVTGNETKAPTVALKTTQKSTSDVLCFDLDLTVNGNPVHDLSIPVTVTFQFPASFNYDSNYTYTVNHIKDKSVGGGSESLPLKITGQKGAYIGTFTTNSFSNFTVVGTAPSNPSNPSNPSTPVTPVTFVSDTTVNFDVNGAYTFKITSKDGKVPTFVVGTANVFDASLVKKDGNDYYFKITAIGAPGAKAGIYVNGTTRLLVATVKSNPSYVKSDTTSPFSVKAGKSYVFKLTANAKPTFVAGTGAAFQVDFVKQSGKDYFFRVTAVGKAGHSSGFYINRLKTPVAKATIA